MGISSVETPFEIGIIIFIVQVMKVSADGNLPRGIQLATVPGWVCPENLGVDSLCFPVWEQQSI